MGIRLDGSRVECTGKYKIKSGLENVWCKFFDVPVLMETGRELVS